MKRKLQNPKILVYKNVEKITPILNNYMDENESEEVAKQILKELGIPLGEVTEISPFRDDIVAFLEDGKVKIEISK